MRKVENHPRFAPRDVVNRAVQKQIHASLVRPVSVRVRGRHGNDFGPALRPAEQLAQLSVFFDQNDVVVEGFLKIRSDRAVIRSVRILQSLSFAV